MDPSAAVAARSAGCSYAFGEMFLNRPGDAEVAMCATLLLRRSRAEDFRGSRVIADQRRWRALAGRSRRRTLAWAAGLCGRPRDAGDREAVSVRSTGAR